LIVVAIALAAASGLPGLCCARSSVWGERIAAGLLCSGALAGLAGAYLSVEHTGMYVEGMTQGRGFIALAAMIFGNWRPGGALAASLLFGASEALSIRGIEGSPVPYQFIKMLPYLLTLAVLAGAGRRTRPPAAVGLPYSRADES